MNRRLFLKLYPFFLHHRQILMRLFLPLCRVGAAVVYAGNNVECPCCRGKYRTFLPFGAPPGRRQNARCPGCFALERHRLLWMYFNNRTNLMTDKLKMLHVAPEFIFQSKLKKLSNLDYLSSDLRPTEAMVQMDITNIELPDDQFDVIYCSHVFEHIPDDRKAMSELQRVLKPGGWAILQVPQNINMELTAEGTDDMTELEREAQFGHHDHQRLYGLDYGKKLEDVGFEVRVDDYAAELGPEAIKRYGFKVGEPIYYCTKPKSRAQSTSAAASEATATAPH